MSEANLTGANLNATDMSETFITGKLCLMALSIAIARSLY
ncbi:pentapeptide repeat-containing protein [Nostoc sp. T09]|nr:pentapeptide repeat-containing protein [Nostoc sp. T09]